MNTIVLNIKKFDKVLCPEDFFFMNEKFFLLGIVFKFNLQKSSIRSILEIFRFKKSF